MSDDPREILKEAGVECAEVDAYDQVARHNGAFIGLVEEQEADAAILALARLVAKYKWQRDWGMTSDVRYVNHTDDTDEAYLDRRWDEYTTGGEV